MLLAGGTAFSAVPEAAVTLVLFNKNDPESADLAAYYAQRREIPKDRVVGLDCPGTEEITREQYETTIAKPVRRLFQKNGWWTMGRGPAGDRIVTGSAIRFVALIRGMPLKIAPDPTIPEATFIPDLPPLLSSRNDASVDSELAVLGMAPPSPGGIVPNPYFRRFTPVLQNPIPPGILLPARLDGPTASIVRAMIDDSIMVEKTGLWGWSFVDGRGITTGGYAEGDQWMAAAVEAMRKQGLPVIFDKKPATFPPGYPITDAAVYYGWYAAAVEGPFAETTFNFRPGAVAVHIHSFSAATLRSAVANWCGPLLARGAAATLGNVYEPYLSLTANLDVFQDRLMAGFTLAESGWIAQRVLSWMTVVVGDPLYRPYAVWYGPGNPPDSAWATYRRLVRAARGSTLAAAPDLLAEADKTKNPVFAEGLGAAQFDAGDFSGALQSFTVAQGLVESGPVRLRIDTERLAAIQAGGLPGASPRPSPSPAVADSSAEMHPMRLNQPLPAALLQPGPVPEESPLPEEVEKATPAPTPVPTPLPQPPLPDLPP
ncbi:MAG: TIGR03790 family protein [Terrimicrobiaceae bacterium]|nr:TIGR03790 family protein [Terrimicrobiaceae bacterium]